MACLLSQAEDLESHYIIKKYENQSRKQFFAIQYRMGTRIQAKRQHEADPFQQACANEQ